MDEVIIDKNDDRPVVQVIQSLVQQGYKFTGKVVDGEPVLIAEKAK